MTDPKQDALTTAAHQFVSFLHAHDAEVNQRDPEPMRMWQDVHAHSDENPALARTGAALVALKLARRLAKAQGLSLADVLAQAERDVTAGYDL